jgi:catechol 2,3-dioxygenase-like lactoylglutathione lyase family enzyme
MAPLHPVRWQDLYSQDNHPYADYTKVRASAASGGGLWRLVLDARGRTSGIGGVFFKAKDPDRLTQWYRTHLGLPVDEHGIAKLAWREDEDPATRAQTVWAPFPHDTEYFGPASSQFMINYRVRDLDAVLAALREEGVWIDERREDSAYGRFAWIADPEGNRIELWQPPKDEPA